MTVLAVDVQGGIADAWTDVTDFAVRLAGALLILLVGVLVAKLVSRAVGKVLERAGFNRAVDRGGIRRFLAHSRYEPTTVLTKLVFWVVVLCALQIALGVFGPNPISTLLDQLVAYLPRVFVAIVVLVVAGALGRVTRDLLRGVLRLTPFGHQLAAAAGIAIVVAGCFVALDQLAVAPAIVTGLWYATLLAAVGVVVVAFGVGGIPVARRYLERAANDLDGRVSKLQQVKAAERAAARAAPPPEPPPGDTLNGSTGSGVARPGVGYPVEQASYAAEHAPPPYPDRADRTPAAYPVGGYETAPVYPTPPASGPSRRDDPATQGTRAYGETPSTSGYPAERPAGGTRPPGEQRRAGTAPPGERDPDGYPRGVPRPFDDPPPRGYGRAGARPGEVYDDQPDPNGFDNYQYPR